MSHAADQTALEPPRTASERYLEQESSVGQFVIHAPTATSANTGSDIKAIFDRDPTVEGVVVMEKDSPVGLIMRTAFYQKLGTMYGHSLYMNRPISILMDPVMLTVDARDGITNVATRAMGRERSKMYDYIILNEGRRYLGVISLPLFFIELSKRNEAQISVLRYQQKELLASNEKQARLTERLKQTTDSMKNLMDHADQGFLFFEEDLIIKEEYSEKCRPLLACDPAGLPFLSLCSRMFKKEQLEIFTAAFESYFKSESPVTDHVYLMLLPSACLFEGRNLSLEYRRITHRENKAVMVIINDVTEKLAMENALEEDRRRQRLISKALSNQAQIRRLLSEFKELFSGGFHAFFRESQPIREGYLELFRAVHTFKGDFAQYGFTSASEALHRFENSLSALLETERSDSIDSLHDVMRDFDAPSITAADVEAVTAVLGASYFTDDELLTLPRQKLIHIERIVESSGPSLPSDLALDLIRSLSRVSLKAQLAEYEDYIGYLSERLIKSKPDFTVEGDDLDIDPDRYHGFLKSLVHVIRNGMDHGLEGDEERLASGKSERGRLRFVVERLPDGFLRVSFSDDGKGVDIEKLKRKAIANGCFTEAEIAAMPDAELGHLVFVDCLSTRDGIDLLSGRGVGMSAFRRECEKLGGRAEFSSVPGRGTTVTALLPM